MKYKEKFRERKRISLIRIAIATAVLSAPSAYAQQQCLGAAVGISTNCQGTLVNATVTAISAPSGALGNSGNPASPASHSLDLLFNNAAESTLSVSQNAKMEKGKEQENDQSLRKGWVIEVSPVFSKYDVDTVAVQRVTMPLSYTIQSDIDPGRKLSLRLPMSSTTWEADRANKSTSTIGVGADYRFPVNDAWTLVPAISYTNSKGDEFVGTKGRILGEGKILALGATSIYNMDLSNSSMSIANMLGYSSVHEANGDVVNNAMTRNGLMWTMPVQMFENPLGLQFFLIHTHYFGSNMYFQNTTEFGINLGSGKSAFSTKDYWRTGLSFTQSDNTKGVSVNIGYWF